jgi:hypothetical protein
MLLLLLLRHASRWQDEGPRGSRAHRHKPGTLRLQLQRRRGLQQVLLLLLLVGQGSPVVQQISQERLGFTCSRHRKLLLLTLLLTPRAQLLLLLLMWVVRVV